ncbi:hypothetical protein GCM10009549_38950 [Streptomyces thermoalcalitolerans]|uniref:ParB/Sulfiredoxin domain-containing protein n=1 Tax=Streptomyces thermoalcalitolerans TaxID=65605 RepID=A0ABN1P1D5_9ACTN
MLSTADEEVATAAGSLIDETVPEDARGRHLAVRDGHHRLRTVRTAVGLPAAAVNRPTERAA